MGGNPTSVAQGWGAGAAVLCAHKGDGTSGLRFASSYFIREGQGRGGAEAGREWCWAGCERSTAQAQTRTNWGYVANLALTLVLGGRVPCGLAPLSSAVPVLPLPFPCHPLPFSCS